MRIIIVKEVVEKSYGSAQMQEMGKRRPYIADEGRVRDIILAGPTHPEYNEEVAFLIKSYSNSDEFLDYSNDGDLLLLEDDLISNNILENLAREGNKVALSIVDELTGWMNLDRLMEILDEHEEIKNKFKSILLRQDI